MAKLRAKKDVAAGGGAVSRAADEILQQAAAPPRRRRRTPVRAVLSGPVPIAVAPDRFRGLIGEAAGARADAAGLEVVPGELMAVLGPAGSGKSRLCAELAGLARAPLGGVWVAGLPLHQLGGAELERFRLQRLGVLYRRPAFFESMSAAGNVEVAAALRGAPAAARAAASAKLLDLVGVGGAARLSAVRLDAGQRRLLALARALAGRPGILLADEPLAGLGAEAAAAVLGVLQEVNRSGLTVVVFTSDPELAAAAERTLRIRDGRVEPAGAPRPVAHAPAALDPPGRIDDASALRLALHLTASRPAVAAAAVGVQAALAAIVALGLGSGPRRGLSFFAAAAVAMVVAGVRLGLAEVSARRAPLVMLRALGARARDLRLVLFAEAALRGGLAGVLGAWAAALAQPQLGLAAALVILVSAAVGAGTAIPAVLAAERVRPTDCS